MEGRGPERAADVACVRDLVEDGRGHGTVRGRADPEQHHRHRCRRAHHPPPFTMASKAVFSIGMTLSRDWRTSGTSRNALSALISSSVTGRLSFRTGARSTATQLPSFAVG